VARTGRSRALKAPFSIRAATAHDRDFVEDLGLRTIASSASRVRGGDPADLRISYARLLEFLFKQSHVLLVAVAAEERLGFLVMLDDLPDEVTGAPQAFVAYMAVEPNARRLRVASALLERAEQLAREKGLPSIALMVTEENRAARELYARTGFVTERRLLAKIL
jgi:ribosomal protein S18 acetylase RimI-like enzyme